MAFELIRKPVEYCDLKTRKRKRASSLKQNAALGKAPVRRVTTQNNHVFAAFYAFFKLECLKMKRHLNHFAFGAHLYLKATRVAFDELQALKSA